MIDFPSNPTDGQLFTSGNSSWVWNAAASQWRTALIPNVVLDNTITAAKLTSTAVTDKLGYTPVNKAGDTINGALVVAGTIQSTGNSDLPAQTGGNAIHTAGYGSPVSGKLLIGDGTGWQYSLAKRTGSVTTDLVTFTDSGTVKLPYQPSFNAYSPAVTASQNNVIWGATRHNIGNCYNTSTGKFTAPVAGRYLFTFNTLMNINGDYVRLWFNLNGAKTAALGDTLTGGTNGTWNAGWSYISIGMSIIIELAANDWIAVWNDGPITTWGTGYGTFSGHLLS